MVEPPRNPEKLQSQLDDFQNLQRQAQILAMQRQQIELQLEELKMAQEELAKASGKVYKATGNLLIETTPAAAKKELTERIETMGVRAASLGKQEEKVKARGEELRQELERQVGKPEA
ncbi:Prefoldin subunit beta [uncultured archaeon]|nr:Prefoldin subunit beta [uncultured archaeon]